MKNKKAQVFHFDLYGKREDKYDFLNDNSVQSIAWTELDPQEPELFFVQKDYGAKSSYDKGFSVAELFLVNSVGIVTARDKFTIHDTKEEVEKTINTFLSLDDETARTTFKLGKDVRDWQVNYARADLQTHYPSKGKFTKVSYRPFDDKWTFYTGKSKGFHCYPRADVMQHFLKGENVGLASIRINKENDEIGYTGVFITTFVSEARLSDRFITNIFPLYLYPEPTLGAEAERVPNFNMEIVEKIAESSGHYFSPERPDYSKQTEETFQFYPDDVLDYIYAVLHSPSYREKYKEFLKIDFPRVPYPNYGESFRKLVALGGEIRQIHLLESPIVEKFITQYPIDGDNVVGKLKYENGKVFINETQYFDNVPQVAWEFYIGGYQPAQKWLKDRKDRALDFEDILHYQKIIVALTETDRLMKEIDKIEIL